MSDILCVTNRVLCREDFTTRLARIAAAGPHAIILREKDLSDEEYAALGGVHLGCIVSHGLLMLLFLYCHPNTAFPRPPQHAVRSVRGGAPCSGG